MKKIFMTIMLAVIGAGSIAAPRRAKAKTENFPVQEGEQTTKYDHQHNAVRKERRLEKKKEIESAQLCYAGITRLLAAYNQEGGFSPLKCWTAMRRGRWENLNLQQRIMALDEWTAAGKPGLTTTQKEI